MKNQISNAYIDEVLGIKGLVFTLYLVLHYWIMRKLTRRPAWYSANQHKGPLLQDNLISILYNCYKLSERDRIMG